MSINLPPSSLPRVVIAGGGFAGLKLAQALDSSHFQIILIDHHNYHQFPPLIYQVASSGLEPSSIAFPFRAAFKRKKNFIFRLANVIGVEPEQKQLITSVGEVPYDYLVLACGGTTNYFGNEQVAKHSLPMKTLYESMNLRNVLLQNIEKALVSDKPETREALLTVVIVGGGPSGVEIAGALAEMKRYVLPKDYPDMEMDQFKIHLIDASPRLLQAMSEKSSRTAAEGLTSLGVEIHQNMMVTDYDGRVLTLGDGTKMNTRTVIWVSGIVANTVEGIQADSLGRGKRILVDGYNEVQGVPDVFALGDQCLMTAATQPTLRGILRWLRSLSNRQPCWQRTSRHASREESSRASATKTLARWRPLAEIVPSLRLARPSGVASQPGSSGSSSTCAPFSRCATRSSSSSTGYGTM